MADIYHFTNRSVYKSVSHDSSDRDPQRSSFIAAQSNQHQLRAPHEVLMAVQSVRTMMRRSGIHYSEFAVPKRLGDYGIGVAIEDFHHTHRGICPICGKRAVQGEPASGWIILAYGGTLEHPSYESAWRCVAGATLPMLAPEQSSNNGEPWNERDMSRSIIDTVQRILHGQPRQALSVVGLGGTVSVVRNTAFGTAHHFDELEPIATVELRVSWTPVFTQVAQPDAAAMIDTWVNVLLQLHTQRMGLLHS